MSTCLFLLSNKFIFSYTTKFSDSFRPSIYCLACVVLSWVVEWLVLFLVFLYHASWCVMCRGVSCVVLWPFDLLLYFISAHLHLSSQSLLPLLALYLINLFSRAYPASSFFVLSCLVLRHTCSLSISSRPSLLYLIYQLYLGLTLLPLIYLLASESL